MKLQFNNPDIAWGYARGLGDPDGLDLIANSEGCIVDIPGCDADSDIGKDIIRVAANLGAVLFEP
jgi:hypothetical protein